MRRRSHSVPRGCFHGASSKTGAVRRATPSAARRFEEMGVSAMLVNCQRLRFVGDSGLDDKKIFERILSEARAEFVI